MQKKKEIWRAALFGRCKGWSENYVPIPLSNYYLNKKDAEKEVSRLSALDRNSGEFKKLVKDFYCGYNNIFLDSAYLDTTE